MVTNNANMNKKTNEVYTSSVEFFNNEETSMNTGKIFEDLMQ